MSCRAKSEAVASVSAMMGRVWVNSVGTIEPKFENSYQVCFYCLFRFHFHEENFEMTQYETHHNFRSTLVTNHNPVPLYLFQWLARDIMQGTTF